MPAHLLLRVYAAAWLAAAIVWLVAALFTKRTVRIESRSSRLAQLAWGLPAAVLMAVPRRGWGPLCLRFIPRGITNGYVWLALTVVGIAFAIWARFYLGRNWSARVTVKEDHELVRSGPYSIVRHPIYAGFLVALAGAVIEIGEIRAILAFVLIAAGLHFKMKTEEQFMREEFGEEYARYQREVKSLIPFVW